MTEATVVVPARQCPARCAPDCLLAIRSSVSELMQGEDGIERSVTITRWHIEQPTAVGLLIAQNARDHLFGHRRGLSDQPIVMGSMKGRGNVVVQIAIR